MFRAHLLLCFACFAVTISSFVTDIPSPSPSSSSSPPPWSPYYPSLSIPAMINVTNIIYYETYDSSSNHSVLRPYYPPWIYHHITYHSLTPTYWTVTDNHTNDGIIQWKLYNISYSDYMNLTNIHFRSVSYTYQNDTCKQEQVDDDDYNDSNYHQRINSIHEYVYNGISGCSSSAGDVWDTSIPCHRWIRNGTIYHLSELGHNIWNAICYRISDNMFIEKQYGHYDSITGDAIIQQREFYRFQTWDTFPEKYTSLPLSCQILNHQSGDRDRNISTQMPDSPIQPPPSQIPTHQSTTISPTDLPTLKPTTTPGTGTGTTSPPTSVGTSQSSDSSSSTSTTAIIIGSIVGVICAILLLLLLIRIIRQRQKRAWQRFQQPEQELGTCTGVGDRGQSHDQEQPQSAN